MSAGIALVIVLTLLLFLFSFTMFRPLAGFFVILACRLLIDKFSALGFGVRGLNASSLFGVFIFLYAVAVVSFSREKRLLPSALIMYYVFVVMVLPSVMVSEDIVTFIAYWMKFVAMACMYIIPYNLIKNEDDLRYSLKAYFLTSIPIVLYGFYQVITSTGYVAHMSYGQTLMKMNSTLVHPNATAFYLSMIMFTLYTILQQRIWPTILTVYLMLMTLTAIVMTYSRSVWLTLSACALFLACLRKRLRMPTLIFFATVLVAFSPIIAERFADLFAQDAYSTNSLEFRIQMTQQLLVGVHESPLIGYGLGSSLSVAQRFASFYTIPHNDYILVLVESGFCGFIGFLIFMVRLVYLHFGKLGQITRNSYLATATAMTLFFAVIIAGTNQLGHIATGGMWFTLMGMMHRGYELTRDQIPGNGNAHPAGQL